MPLIWTDNHFLGPINFFADKIAITVGHLYSR